MSSDRFRVNNIVNFGQKYIYQDDNKPSNYNTLCEKMIVKLIGNTTIIMVSILIAYSIIGCNALYVFIFDGTRLTFVGTEIPFVDINTDTGFLINIVEQFFLTSVSLTANITIEIGVCLVHNAFEMIPSLMQFDSDELKNELQLNGMSSNAKMRLRNIFMKVQDYNR